MNAQGKKVACEAFKRLLKKLLVIKERDIVFEKVQSINASKSEEEISQPKADQLSDYLTENEEIFNDMEPVNAGIEFPIPVQMKRCKSMPATMRSKQRSIIFRRTVDKLHFLQALLDQAHGSTS